MTVAVVLMQIAEVTIKPGCAAAGATALKPDFTAAGNVVPCGLESYQRQVHSWVHTVMPASLL